jgi:CRISPR-associated protein Csm2
MSDRSSRSQASSGPIPRPTADDLKAIIRDGDAESTVEWGEQLGGVLAMSLTTSQFRNVFSTIRQIEMTWPVRASESEVRAAARRLVLLRPKLAYQASREAKGGAGMATLRDVLGEAITLVGQDRDRFQHFVDFCEAILAYHTAAVR